MFSRLLPSLRALFTRRRPAPRPFAPPYLGEIDGRTRLALRDWLALPTTQLVLGILEARHPGRGLPRMFAHSEWDERAAVNVLARINGWETCIDAIREIATPSENQPVDVNNETYPDQE